MKIFLSGVSCVGKSTIGKILAEQLGHNFFDLDDEIETFFGTSIEKLQSKFLTQYSFRKQSSKALKNLLSKKQSKRCVIALPPSGLMDPYWRIVEKSKGTIVVLKDSPENILERISFFDIDSRPIQKVLTEKEKTHCFSEIKKDIAYFGLKYIRAGISVDLQGLGPIESANKVKESLEQFKNEKNKI